MIFTERLFRTFALINFLTSLTKSNVVHTFAAVVRSPIPPPPLNIDQLTNAHLLPSPFMYLPCQISTVQPSTRDMLLFDHGPVGSSLSRGPRRNLGHFTNIRAGSGCRLIPKDRDPAGCVRERLERLLHGDLRVSTHGYVNNPRGSSKVFLSSLSAPR